MPVRHRGIVNIICISSNRLPPGINKTESTEDEEEVEGTAEVEAEEDGVEDDMMIIDRSSFDPFFLL